MKASPSDKNAKLKYTECNKVVKKLAFEKAISVEETKKNIAATINLDAMSKYCNIWCVLLEITIKRRDKNFAIIDIVNFIDITMKRLFQQLKVITKDQN